jgi:hypothetical protein
MAHRTGLRFKVTMEFIISASPRIENKKAPALFSIVGKKVRFPFQFDRDKG